jgi:putative acetyltransferase
MNPVTITQENPQSPDARALIAGSETEMRAVYPPEDCHTLSPDELDHPHIAFYVARRNGAALGCVALVNNGDYGEVKRLFVVPEGRGSGLSKQLMDHLEAAAKQAGLARVLLETGDQLTAAVRLYEQRGYTVRGPFACYEVSPASLFMEKTL